MGLTTGRRDMEFIAGLLAGAVVFGFGAFWLASLFRTGDPVSRARRGGL